MEHVRRAAQDDGPGCRRPRDQPERVLARPHLVPFEAHGMIERDARRRIGAGMPHAVPRHETAEQLAPASDRAAVLHRDRRVRHVLRDAAALAERISLGARGRTRDAEHETAEEQRARARRAV